MEGTADIRDDLPPRVKKFVEEHELYHLTDKYKFWGLLGSELRANIIPGLKDPIGLFLTIRASLAKERILLYNRRFRDKF